MRKAAIVAAALAMMAAGCSSAPDNTLTAEEFRGMDKASQSAMIECQYDAFDAKTTTQEGIDYGLKIVQVDGDMADMQAKMWADGYGPHRCDVLLPDFQGGE